MWKHSGIRPILRLPCLRRPSILKPWVSLFALHSVWSASIHKKILLSCCRCFICLLICLQVSGTSKVFAQSYLIMTVSGSQEYYSYVNGDYYYEDNYNGKARYTRNCGDGAWCSIYWQSDSWRIETDVDGALYYSATEVVTPNLATNWIQGWNGGTAPYIVVTGGGIEVTPTMHPLFPTKTPGPPKDYTCPGEQPGGFGVSTPSANWLLHCGDCITPVPRYEWPTPPAGISGTPTPAPTSGPTPTPTATPGPMHIRALNDVPIVNIPAETDKIVPISHSYDLYGYLGGFPLTFKVRDYGEIIFNNSTNIYSHEAFYLAISAPNYSNGEGIDITILESEGLPSLTVNEVIHLYPSASPSTATIFIPLWTVAQTDAYGNNPVHITKTWKLTYEVKIYGMSTYNPSTQSQFSMWSDVAVGLGTFTGNKTYSWTLDDFPVNPINSICSEIEEEYNGGINDPDDPNFKLPYIAVGEGLCTGIPSIDMDMTWLQTFWTGAPDRLVFGGVEFCFAPISFGSLNIFGITTDLDLLAMVICGVLMFKVITR